MNKIVYVAINESNELLTEYGNTVISTKEPNNTYEYSETGRYEWVPAMLIISDKE
jgi:hypothetical protein